MLFLSYYNHKICVNVGAPTLLLLLLLSAFAAPVRAEDHSSLLQADKAFTAAFQQRDSAAATKVLSPDFAWIDSVGQRLTRARALATFPAIANAGVAPQARSYGNSAVVWANQGKVNVLRVWVKTAAGWQILLYQEVTQVEKSEPVNSTLSGDCRNPCQEIPLQPATPSEKAAIASWQGVMRAMAENDADAYAPLIADEFTATDTFHDRPYNKADRLAQIQNQKLSGKHNAPPELISAEMFDLGETVLMIAREQRRGAKPYFNSRMWINRSARWQMLFSFNTRIE
jgi:ketosteroid isomerase-like protein